MSLSENEIFLVIPKTDIGKIDNTFYEGSLIKPVILKSGDGFLQNFETHLQANNVAYEKRAILDSEKVKISFNLFQK